jgi:hypothetical protein
MKLLCTIEIGKELNGSKKHQTFLESEIKDHYVQQPTQQF